MTGLDGLRAVLGGGLLTGEADILSYSYDGALDRGRPDAVAVVRSAEEAQAVVRWCVERRVPYVARGAGTNLSGGCIPLRGGIVLSLARMDRLLAIDTRAGLAVVEPGLVNLRLQKELEKIGFFYAPDPASYKVCTIGGNIGENAGGPRCLKYGVTTHHVRRLEVVMPDGTLERFSADDAGPEIMSLLVGAEGTLGVVTKAWVDILPAPESISTALAAFGSLDDAMACVSDVIAAGVLPRVLEAMDRFTVESIEAYIPAGYPRAAAVLLIEVEGSREHVSVDLEKVRALCARRGCMEYRLARDSVEREKLWEGRRGAYAALARLAPNVLVEDGVVPRSRLPEAAARLEAIAREHRVSVGLLFHAGDGNLHPNIIFDERDQELTARVKKAGFEMLKACVELGGSISGEHGIGIDKRAAMAWLFSEEALSLFGRIKRAFDPEALANPDKLFPLAGERPPGELRPPLRRPLSSAALSLAERVREKAGRKEEIALIGAGTKVPRDRRKISGEVLSTRGLDKILELDRADYTVTVEAGISPLELCRQLESEGFYVPLPFASGTLGGLLATKPWTGLRTNVLGMRLLLVDGTVADFGAKVVKNVAGYDVPRLLLGSWGTLAVILEVTLKLSPVRAPVPESLPPLKPFVMTHWWRRLKQAFDPGDLLNAWVEKTRCLPSDWAA